MLLVTEGKGAHDHAPRPQRNVDGGPRAGDCFGCGRHPSTLGELNEGAARNVIAKEGLLGLLNGTLVGLTAGLGMFVFATAQGNPDALRLALVVLMA